MHFTSFRGAKIALAAETTIKFEVSKIHLIYHPLGSELSVGVLNEYFGDLDRQRNKGTAFYMK